MLGKEVFILTMDEKGRLYAQDAGFKLKFLPKAGGGAGLSDIKFHKKQVSDEEQAHHHHVQIPEEVTMLSAVKQAAKKFMPKDMSSAHKPVQVESSVVETHYFEPMPPVETTDNIFPMEAADSYIEPAKHKRAARVVTGFTIASLVLILLLYFVVLPKATVMVFAKTEPVTRDMEISMSVNAQKIDSDKLIMPAALVNETVNVNDKFQSQGKKQVGNAATGTVKIYNFTKAPITLKANTTNLVVGSKTYTLLSDVILLKPTTYKNAKTKEVDPASLGDSVSVQATSGGDDFNLPAGTRMEISNQVFGSKPQFLYAVTDTEVTGGTTRYLSVISQDDIDSAKAQLQKTALAEITQKLQAQGAVMPPNGYTMSITQFTTDSPAGTQTPSFQATLQAQVSGLSFKSDDLNKLISQRITQTLASNKTLEQGQAAQTTYVAKNLDLTNQLALLEVHYQGQAVFNLDLPDIAPELVGKSQSQVNEILQSKAEIDKVEITLAPAWQKNFPYFASKIHVIVGQEAPGTN